MPRKVSIKDEAEFTKVLNRKNGNESKIKEEDSKVTARKRWSILARALFKEDSSKIADVSVRRFTSFGLLIPKLILGNWFEYATNDGNFNIQISHLQGNFSAQDLIGFNNTGNICIWPSEETLAVYMTSNLSDFDGKNVLELGGGMSCLAGLLLAKYGQASRVHVTDGNEKSVENVRLIISKNQLKSKATCGVLQWEDAALNRNGIQDVQKFDVILVADCLFFDDAREALIRTVSLRLSPGGTAFIMAPQRGKTLQQFIQTSRCFGFSCVKNENYNPAIWQRHLDLLKTNSNYDPSLHYPLLLTMTKTN